MLEQSLKLLHLAGEIVCLIAIGIIIIGLVINACRYVLRFKKLGVKENFKRLKLELGNSLSLGLEILVLADVVSTITIKPSYTSLGFLFFLVIIRTIVGWTLTVESYGYWPWQLPKKEQANDQTSS